MQLNELKPALGASKNRKRVGRGTGSGHGKTSTKGHKGQKARSGGSVKPGFEGGQMPLQRRLPKRGFNSLDRIEYVVVNVGQLDAFDVGTVVDSAALVATGLVKKESSLIKVLAQGEITKALIVKGVKFSAAAKEKILAAGGTAEEI